MCPRLFIWSYTHCAPGLVSQQSGWQSQTLDRATWGMMEKGVLGDRDSHGAGCVASRPTSGLREEDQAVAEPGPPPHVMIQWDETRAGAWRASFFPVAPTGCQGLGLRLGTKQRPWTLCGGA